MEVVREEAEESEGNRVLRALGDGVMEAVGEALRQEELRQAEGGEEEDEDMGEGGEEEDEEGLGQR